MTDSAQTPKTDLATATPVVPKLGSLHISNLDRTVTESLLYHLFCKSIGAASVASIRVCKDSQSGNSLGYAYANFRSIEDAQKAMKSLNNTEIAGKRCRISWATTDPSLRKSGIGNLFIKCLAKDIDSEDLADVFSAYGDISSIKIALDANGESKGYGFVHFVNLQDSVNATRELHGKCFNGKQVHVAKFIPKKDRPTSNGGADHYTNIYLKHINPAVTSQQFDELVEKLTSDIGLITSPKLMVELVEKDGKTEEKSRLFGFVNFENHETAVKALERFKDDAKVKEIAPELVAPEKTLYANRAIPRSERMGTGAQQQNVNLYVKNLSENIDDEQLRDLFKEFGAIGSAVVMRDPETNISRGFGFVCFESPQSAADAITKMGNSTKVQGKPLYVALAQNKKYRALHLAQLHQSRSIQRNPFPPYGAPYYYQQQRRPGPFPRHAPNYQQVPMHSRFQMAPMDQDQVRHQVETTGGQLLQKLYEDTSDDIPLSKSIMGYLTNNDVPIHQTLETLKEYLQGPEKRKILIAQRRSVGESLK